MPSSGLLYVDGRFTDPNLTEAAFDKWYDEVHIPHLLTLSGCDSASRYVDLDDNAREPYITLYPLKDVDWVHSSEFEQVNQSLEADYLPQRNAAKSVDFDARAYTMVDSIEGTNTRPGAAKFVILTELAPTSGRSSPSSISSKESTDSLTLGNLGSHSSRPGLKRATRYYLHNDQPELWLKRWQEGERWRGTGGWPIKDVLIQEFDDSQSPSSVQKVAEDLDAAESEHGHFVAKSRAYRLTSAFE